MLITAVYKLFKDLTVSSTVLEAAYDGDDDDDDDDDDGCFLADEK